MLLGRTGSASTPVSSRAATYQYNNVSRSRNLPVHMVSRSRADYRADFHSLGNVILIVHFIHKSGGKSDLVSVGTVSGRRALCNLSLRKFSRKGFFHRFSRVR